MEFIIQFRPWETKHIFWLCIVFFIWFSFLPLIQFICFGLISFFTCLTTPSIEVLYLSMNRVCQYKALFYFHPSMCIQSDLGEIFTGVQTQQGHHASISYLSFLTQLTRVLIIAIQSSVFAAEIIVQLELSESLLNRASNSCQILTTGTK